MSILRDENEKSVLKREQVVRVDIASSWMFQIPGHLELHTVPPPQFASGIADAFLFFFFFICQELFLSDIFERHQDDGTTSPFHGIARIPLKGLDGLG